MTGDRLFGFHLSYLMEDPSVVSIVIFYYPDNGIYKLHQAATLDFQVRQSLIKDSKVYINNSFTPVIQKKII